ncbi:hypothetical protein K1719_047550, partial [Acacia pycnantha]
HGQKSYPLRPELIESTYWLYKATRDPRKIKIMENEDLAATLHVAVDITKNSDFRMDY